MPTVQVIQRQEDPIAKAIGSAGNDIADALHKQQSLKLTGRYYDILAKNADNEHKKLEYQQLSDAANHLQDVVKISDPQQRGMAFKVLHDAGALDFNKTQVVGNKAEEYYKILAAPTQTEQAQLQETQSKAANMAAMTNLMRQSLGQSPIPDVGAQGADVPQTPTSEPSAPVEGNYGLPSAGASPLAGAMPLTTAARLSAMGQPPTQPQSPQQDVAPASNAPVDTTAPAGNRLMFAGISGGQPQFVNIDAKNAESFATSSGTEMAKKTIAHNQFVNDFGVFKDVNEMVPRTEGGIKGRIITGVSNFIKSKDQGDFQGQMLASYDGAVKRLKSTLARQVDVGNLSESEQTAAAQMIPKISDAKGTATIKMSFIEDMTRLAGSHEHSKIKELIANYKQQFQDEHTPNSPRAQAVSRITGKQSATKQPAGAAYYSKTTQKYYDAQGEEL